MSRLLKSLEPLSQYKDRKFDGSLEEYVACLRCSTTVYVGNLAFHTTEEQIHELFSKCGPLHRIVMGLDKNQKTPCGFCFVEYGCRRDTEECVKYLNGARLDERDVRIDFDWCASTRAWPPATSARALLTFRVACFPGDFWRAASSGGARAAARCATSTARTMTSGAEGTASSCRRACRSCTARRAPKATTPRALSRGEGTSSRRRTAQEKSARATIQTRASASARTTTEAAAEREARHELHSTRLALLCPCVSSTFESPNRAASSRLLQLAASARKGRKLGLVALGVRASCGRRRRRLCRSGGCRRRRLGPKHQLPGSALGHRRSARLLGGCAGSRSPRRTSCGRRRSLRHRFAVLRACHAVREALNEWGASRTHQALSRPDEGREFGWLGHSGWHGCGSGRVCASVSATSVTACPQELQVLARTFGGLGGRSQRGRRCGCRLALRLRLDVIQWRRKVHLTVGLRRTEATGASQQTSDASAARRAPTSMMLTARCGLVSKMSMK